MVLVLLDNRVGLEHLEELLRSAGSCRRLARCRGRRESRLSGIVGRKLRSEVSGEGRCGGLLRGGPGADLTDVRILGLEEEASVGLDHARRDVDVVAGSMLEEREWARYAQQGRACTTSAP